jgi:hypothetical protein
MVDREISGTLQQHMQEAGILLRLGEDVYDVYVAEGEEPRVHVRLSSGEFVVENLLYAIGRTGSTAGLNLAAAGLAAGAGDTSQLTTREADAIRTASRDCRHKNSFDQGWFGEDVRRARSSLPVVLAVAQGVLIVSLR